MDSFLRTSKRYLDDINRYTIVKIVIGNPTCDLDSAICALVYAFHHYINAKDDNQDIAVIPLLNIPEKEFRLKTEVVYYLKKHNISSELLTFRDHLNLETLNNEKKLGIVLVDHHTLSENDKNLADSVVEIIDHRPQDPKWLWPKLILQLELVGSCATLITRILLENKSKTLNDPLTCSLLRDDATICGLRMKLLNVHSIISKAFDPLGLSQSLQPATCDFLQEELLRSILIGCTIMKSFGTNRPILVDTANFSKRANKATPLDVEVIKKLEELGSISYDREQEYKELLEAKTDISSLSASDLLNKDLKLTNGIPISGLPILVENFIQIDGCFEELTEFTKQYKFPVTIVMGLSLTNNLVTRDIAIFTLRSNELENKIIKALIASNDPPLKLTKIPTNFKHDDHNFTLFKIGNIEASRKQILPIINGISIDCLC